MKHFMAILMAILFLVTPFFRGLFFDSDFYLIHIIVFILFVIQVLRSYIHKDTVPTSFYTIFFVPFAYFLSFFVAASPNNALIQLFRWGDYAAFFIVLLSVSKDKRFKSMMPYIFVLLGVFLSVFAVLGFYHLVSYQDVILLDPSGDKRFTSVFQYANTFATVVCAFWLFSLIWLTQSNLTWLKVILLALPLSIYALDFFHTYSRGALLLVPLAWLVGLLLLPFSRQVLYIIYTIISVASGLILFNKDSSPVLLLIIVVISALVILAVDFGLRDRFKSQKIDQLKSSRFFIVLIALLCGGLLLLDFVYKGFIFRHLPPSLQGRFSDISMETYSVWERNLYYTDAVKIIREHPILGVGGSGWKVLFTHIQELPYWSNETHNGYLEVLLSTGWVGLILFLTVFAFLFYKAFRGYLSKDAEVKSMASMALPALTMIFTHSSMDFNFSFGTVWFIVLFLFAMSVDSNPNKDLLVKKSVFHYSLVSILLIFVFVSSIYTLRFYTAEKNQLNAIQFEDIQGLAKRNPYNVDYQISLMNGYTDMLAKTHDPQYKNMIIETMKTLEKLEPDNANVTYNLGLINVKLGQYDQALNYFRKTLDNDHYNVKYYNHIMNVKSQLIQLSAKNKDKAGIQKYSESILSDYQLMNNWLNKMQDKKINPLNINERNFNIQSTDKLYAGQALYFTKKYIDMIPLLEGIKNDKNQQVKQQSLALLAAAYLETGQMAQTEAILKSNKELNIGPIYAFYVSTAQ
jgi:tetratricopeptide (TPR) repeat protein